MYLSFSLSVRRAPLEVSELAREESRQQLALLAAALFFSLSLSPFFSSPRSPLTCL